jgi:hypothetical protein
MVVTGQRRNDGALHLRDRPGQLLKVDGGGTANNLAMQLPADLDARAPGRWLRRLAQSRRAHPRLGRRRLIRGAFHPPGQEWQLLSAMLMRLARAAHLVFTMSMPHSERQADIGVTFTPKNGRRHRNSGSPAIKHRRNGPAAR